MRITSSLHKQTYGFLLKNRFPGLVLVPSGGKDFIRSFGQIVENVLNKALWGVDFFMLCDRDSADTEDIVRLQSETKGRLRFLGKYHLENYFLDATVIARIFEDLEPDDSWLRNPDKIEARLREIALASLSYTTALIVSARVRRRLGNVNVMPKGSHNKPVDDLVGLIVSKVVEESARAQSALNGDEIEGMVRHVFNDLSGALQDPSDKWKSIIPAKQLLSQFAATAGIDIARFKLAYLRNVAQYNLPVFDEVISIFEDFSSVPIAGGNKASS